MQAVFAVLEIICMYIYIYVYLHIYTYNPCKHLLHHLWRLLRYLLRPFESLRPYALCYVGVIHTEPSTLPSPAPTSPQQKVKHLLTTPLVGPLLVLGACLRLRKASASMCVAQEKSTSPTSAWKTTFPRRQAIRAKARGAKATQ